tara:strand:- start:4981 stop:5565 length:585 start_codon:yes stop_codon:yes gene_type:complete
MHNKMNKNKLLNKTKLGNIIHLTFSNWGFSWGGVIDNRKGEYLLFAQLFLILAHLIPAWPKISNTNFILGALPNILGFLLFIIGLFLAINALVELGTNISPLPEPKKGALLITKGAYSYCRHPLYQAIIICSLGFTIYKSSILHLLLFTLLSIVLRLKSKREEESLKKIHDSYEKYMSLTTALIPGIRFLDWRH